MKTLLTATARLKPRKRTITPMRAHLRTLTWNRVVALAQHVIAISPCGEASRMARELGLDSSQVHRLLCPRCEHDQEPTFTVGFSLMVYCLQRLGTPEIVINPIKYNTKGGTGRVRNYPQAAPDMY